MSDSLEPNEIPDGFRPRHVREPGWLARAIAAGEVRDPDAEDETPDYSSATVIQPPVASLNGTG